MTAATAPTFAAAKAALKSLWVPALAPVHVIYGPRTKPGGPEWLRILGITGNHNPISEGPFRDVEEQYTIACTLTVTRVGDGDEDLQQDVTERAAAIYTAAELAVRSTPAEALAVPGVLLAMVTGRFTSTEAAPAADVPCTTTMTFGVDVRADYSLGP